MINMQTYKLWSGETGDNIQNLNPFHSLLPPWLTENRWPGDQFAGVDMLIKSDCYMCKLSNTEGVMMSCPLSHLQNACYDQPSVQILE